MLWTTRASSATRTTRSPSTANLARSSPSAPARLCPPIWSSSRSRQPDSTRRSRPWSTSWAPIRSSPRCATALPASKKSPSALAGSTPSWVSARVWMPHSSTASSPLPTPVRFVLARPPAPTPRPSPPSTSSTRAVALPTPSRLTSHTACGPSLCSTTASTRPAWPTAAPTEAPRNGAPSSVVALFPPCAKRLQSPMPKASS